MWVGGCVRWEEVALGGGGGGSGGSGGGVYVCVCDH